MANLEKNIKYVDSTGDIYRLESNNLGNFWNWDSNYIQHGITAEMSEVEKDERYFKIRILPNGHRVQVEFS